MAYLTCYQTVDMTRAIGAVKVTSFMAGQSMTVTAADHASYYFYGSLNFDAAGNATGTIDGIYNYGASGGLIYSLTGLTYSFAEAVTPTTSDPDAIVFAGNDTIVGSSGNDAIIYYGGNDYFDGGAGTDKIILSGAYADYTVSQSAGYYTLTSSGGTVTVVNVESVAFSGGSDVRALAEVVPVTYAAAGTVFVDEAGGAVTVTVTASSNTATTTLGWKVTSSAATGGDFTDGTLPSGTVTLTNGVGSFSLSVLDDAVAEIDEAYTITVYDLTTGGEVASLAGTIVNDDTSGVTYTAAGAGSVNESSGAVSVTVTASAGVSTTLGWKVTSTAATGGDFTGGTLPSGTVTLTGGVGSFSVSVLDDAIAEIDEGYTITLYDPTTGSEVAALSGTIVNDDATALVLTGGVDSLVGSSATDLFDGSTPGSLGTGDTIVGGDGLDWLSASLAAGSVAPVISGVEAMATYSTVGAATVDLSASSGYVAVWAGGSNDITFANLTGTTKVGIRNYVGSTDGTAVEFLFANGQLNGSSDTVTLTLSAVGNVANAPNVVVAGGPNSNGGEQLTVIVEDGDSHLSGLTSIATNTNSLCLTSLTIKGSQDLTIDSAVEFATTSGVVNAAQLSGALTITTGSGNESITGGSGNDWLSGGLGDDTLTGGAGSNTFVVSNLESTILTSADIDTITDFDAATDRLAAAVVPLAFTDLGSFDGYTDVQSALRVLASTVGTGNAAQFTYSGSTYVFVGDGIVGLSGGDTLINVTGLTGTLSVSNFVAG